jgi:DNA-binding transcriptional ArsR family regulator
MKDEGSRVRPVACPRDEEAVMRRFRFSIASLLVVILFVSVALAALRMPTDAWDSGVLGLTLLILLTATLLAVHRTHRQRAYWLGFALFGWTSLIASVIPPIGSRLPTTMGLAFIDSKIPGREITVSAVFAYTNTAGTNPVRGYVVPPQGNAVVPSPPAISTPIVFRLLSATTGKFLAGPGGTATIVKTKAVAKATRTPRGAALRRKQAQEAAILLKHVSDPTRLKIVLLLAEGEKHVGGLCKTLKHSQTATSQHLALLRHGDIIARRRQGKHYFYALTERGERLASIVKRIAG